MSDRNKTTATSKVRTSRETATGSIDTHDVAKSGVIRFGIGFARTVTVVERSYLEMHSLAEEFLRAADCLLQARSTSAPVYVLQIHAIELALKSFLLRTGCTKPQLERMRHDLTKIYDKALANGLAHAFPEASGIIDRLATSMEKSAIRYQFPHTMPLAGDVAAVVHSVLEVTQPPVPARFAEDAGGEADP